MKESLLNREIEIVERYNSQLTNLNLIYSLL